MHFTKDKEDASFLQFFTIRETNMTCNIECDGSIEKIQECTEIDLYIGLYIYIGRMDVEWENKERMRYIEVAW